MLEFVWKLGYHFKIVRCGNYTKCSLFIIFTICYIYLAYKTLPRRTLGAKSIRNINISRKIIRRLEETGIDFYAIEEEMALRRERIYNTCQKQKNNSETASMWELVVDAHHSLVWCKVHKAASDTWVQYFNILGGYDEKFLRKTKRNPLNLLRSVFPRPTLSQLQKAQSSSLSFLIVRDPLERLLSTYLSLIARDPKNDKYYSQIKYRIQQMTYQENVDEEPNFPNFIEYILQNKQDEYWSPIDKICSPCTINFTVIAKMETLLEDEEYIIKKAGIDDILTPSKVRLHYLAHDKGKTKQLLKKYYSKLNIQQLFRLTDMYSLDYEMFGYNMTIYFTFGSN